MARKLPSLCAAIARLCGLASDARGWDFARSGPYLGIAGSYDMDRAAEDSIQDQLDALGHAIEVRPKDSFGLQGRLGWRFAPHFAAEIQAEYLFGFEIRALGWQLTGHEVLVGTLNAKLPLSTRDVQPFLLVGGGALYVDLEDSVGAGEFVDDLGPVLRGGAARPLPQREHRAECGHDLRAFLLEREGSRLPVHRLRPPIPFLTDATPGGPLASER